MIIVLLIQYLMAGLADYFDPILSDDLSDGMFGDTPSMFVGVEAPEQLTNYVLIDQTGSDTANHITTTTLAIQSYAPTLQAALLLNEAVKSLMLDFVSAEEVSAVRLETDYNFTDTTTKQYRWQAVYQVTHYLGGF